MAPQAGGVKVAMCDAERHELHSHAEREEREVCGRLLLVTMRGAGQSAQRACLSRANALREEREVSGRCFS